MRINIVNPSQLLDQHLIAEIREIKMLPKSLVRSIKSARGLCISDISSTYTLNKGHGYFFYDKLLYIEDRFQELLQEAKERGFNITSTELYYPEFDYSSIPSTCYGNYEPTKEEQAINIERIDLRVQERPSFYRYCGEYID